MAVKSPNGDFILNDEDIEIVEVLLKTLKQKKETISYKELSESISTKPDPHFGLTNPLWRIGHLCFQLGLPFITGCVIKANNKLPGEGIESLYEDCGIDLKGKSLDQIYKEEREKIRSCNNWQKLADYLHIPIVMPLNGEVIYPDEIPKQKVREYIEGAAKQIYVNSYERDRHARNECLKYYSEKDGCIRCQICGFDFGKKYGERYQNIIEVHHIKPLSEIKGSYVVDPKRDLLPVCPNCHVVLHSEVGETVEELKNRMKNKQQSTLDA